ncbi:hypothetical protein E2562_017126 [Oryza meyeriana var. granulata]|uniref:Uncharacterized protein n=1 Tax=Oryza meyeriana var. granulata TaxID=110450 RepID=A0A6G1DWJ8_9ORYZ|nr:hypothetical protein E2562_017126 [Oryza meyeriana var. granulata]
MAIAGSATPSTVSADAAPAFPSGLNTDRPTTERNASSLRSHLASGTASARAPALAGWSRGAATAVWFSDGAGAPFGALPAEIRHNRSTSAEDGPRLYSSALHTAS